MFWGSSHWSPWTWRAKIRFCLKFSILLLRKIMGWYVVFSQLSSTVKIGGSGRGGKKIGAELNAQFIQLMAKISHENKSRSWKLFEKWPESRKGAFDIDRSRGQTIELNVNLYLNSYSIVETVLIQGELILTLHICQFWRGFPTKNMAMSQQYGLTWYTIHAVWYGPSHAIMGPCKQATIFNSVPIPINCKAI